MFKFLMFFFCCQVAICYIYHDTGITRAFDYSDFTGNPTFVCSNGYSKTATINFSDSFENIPQVFFTSETYDMEQAEMEFQISITTITTTSFTMYLQCSKRRLYVILIRWFALDDQRIEVISNFNMQNPADKTFSIKNPNAQTGFVAFTSMHYIGQIDFLLSISEITTQSVTVSITKVAGKFTNLKQVGYFVVVGVQEAFINLGLKSVTGGFSSGSLPLQPNRWFAIATQGFKYANGNNMWIRATFTYTATTMSYTWGTWMSVETPNSHSQVWIAYQYTISYQPLECFSIRTSRKYVFDISLLPTFNLQLVQLNQIYTTIGNYDQLIDKSISPLKIQIEVKCEHNKKIQADFNKCNSCTTKKIQSFTYSCSSQINYVGFFPLFKQAFQQYNIIKINLQPSSLEITQVVYDQTIKTSTIVKIQILDQ